MNTAMTYALDVNKTAMIQTPPDGASVAYAEGWEIADWSMKANGNVNSAAPEKWEGDKANGFLDRLALERKLLKKATSKSRTAAKAA